MHRKCKTPSLLFSGKRRMKWLRERRATRALMREAAESFPTPQPGSTAQFLQWCNRQMMDRLRLRGLIR